MQNLLEEHVRRTNQQSPDVFLGRLCWYTVHEMRGEGHEMIVSHKNVVQGLVKVGLGDKQIPPYPRDFDVFRRVCHDAQIKKTPVAGRAGMFTNHKLVEVSGRSDQNIVRRIVMETVDNAGHKLDYKQLRDVMFDRDTCAITFAACDDYLADVPTAKAISEKVQKAFLAQRGMLTSWSVRQFIRQLLTDQGATCVRSGGGVYFLAEANATHVAAVEDFVNGLPGDIGEFHSLPLIDDGKQREMIKKAFEAETAGACDDLMIEIREIRKAGKEITQERYGRMVTQYKDLHTKTRDYGSILETTLGETKSRLELLEKGIVKLSQNIVTKADTNGSH